MLAENWFRGAIAMGEAANLLASRSKQSCWLLLSILGVSTVALPAVADNPPPIFFHNEERQAPMYYYHMMAAGVMASASAMAQGIPQPSPLPPGSIGVTASSVNGVPRAVTHTKTGSGTYVSATASSTSGGTASAFASVSVTRFDVPRLSQSFPHEASLL